ncbi:helix-turn-helix domain-containing protein [Pontivivens ytuae]|uniref:Helix-turn-helix domain-containing protein n=1 Tax=Pontivivens ytuae TaxID=2789856 RepID=A0A7S9LTA9_9RHOB|nr:helix-turn-helix domain-containing protein [Pontivivens ytuae]QPH54663.1 helix-turn-helix domain-containing protein [Pontivivens ytuae]QPH54739.1 helix-turn-helix domain-containing protein [Pontivivens ytuae]
MDHIARTPKQIGDALRRIRRSQDQTQSETGRKAGLRQETLSKIETGNPATKIQTICDILAALDLELVIRERSKGAPDEIEDIF